MKKTLVALFSFLTAVLMNAQDDDSLITKKDIEEVVLTAQYNPQSINKSIYKVEVIDAEQIKNMAATNVAEVLNQNLNILVVADTSSGNSSANILGLGGEYTKVLIDNIPVVNDEGLGNLFDLTKISLNNIEKIEIVKGSMGVEYGNNAVVAVINIITKKSSSKKFFGNVALQEETVGKEYDWYKKGQGRHIQILNLGYNISENWFVSADFNHNDFQGFWGTQKGYRYFSEINDKKRGYEWQPKDQMNVGGLIKYSKNKTNIFYKINLLREEINYRDSKIEPLNFAGGERTYIAHDRDYFTTRWLHQLNLISNLGTVKYMGDFSYQTQLRELQKYIYDIPARKEISREEKRPFYDINILYSRGMFSHFLDDEKLDFQLGYELDRTDGFASQLTEQQFFRTDVKRTIFNYANFFSAEWNALPKFYVRPGARLALSDKFDHQFNYSLVLKYSATPKMDIRLSGGSANRFPKYEELFSYLMDANHDIHGNENLKPETGVTIGLFWDYKNINENRNINVNFSGMYMDLKDKIELATINLNPLQFLYINVDGYKSLLFSGNFGYKKGNFTFNSGVSLTGISREIKVFNSVSPTKFYFYPEANISANYKLNPTKTLFALYYKYSGSSKQYYLEDVNLQGVGKYSLEKIGDFSMMNATISQPFFKDHLELTLGIKNIFDVTSIESTAQSRNILDSSKLFYGRSYFARLMYGF
ncbi:MAG: TonB-dependent receptor plug domain-containing protein [Flavobacteriaceae bacterium]|jgi:outer membrane receptor for ferrienterochelin and colicins|nr:TonB-dependent receptor plug domain-containing protein [Flavobacteriaceae bacterium]